MIGFYFTWMLAITGTLYGWINPLYGLMVYWAFALLRPQSLWFWSFGGSGSRFSLFIGIATLVGWLGKGCGDWSSARWVKAPLIGVGFYLLANALAMTITPVDNANAWDRMSEVLSDQFKIGLMLLLTISLVTEAASIRVFAWVVTLTLGYLAYNFNMLYLQNPNFLLNRGFGGVDNNGAAMIMAMGVPLCFFMAVYTRNWILKGLCLLMAMFMVHAVMFSYSRGGMLGMIMVALLLFTVAIWTLPNKFLTVALGVVGVLVALVLAGPAVREEFKSIFVGANALDASAASRFATWGAAWQCFLEHPLGTGPRGFNFLAHQYGLSRGKSVHNLLLQTAADSGILGVTGLLIYFVGTMWSTFTMTLLPTARRLVWPVYFGHMVMIAIASFLVSSMFIGVESVEASWIVAMVGLATVGYVRTVAELEPTEETPDLPELEQVPDPHRGKLVAA